MSTFSDCTGFVVHRDGSGEAFVQFNTGGGKKNKKNKGNIKTNLATEQDSSGTGAGESAVRAVLNADGQLIIAGVAVEWSVSNVDQVQEYCERFTQASADTSTAQGVHVLTAHNMRMCTDGKRAADTAVDSMSMKVPCADDANKQDDNE